jgi:hypothetical protein
MAINWILHMECRESIIKKILALYLSLTYSHNPSANMPHTFWSQFPIGTVPSEYYIISCRDMLTCVLHAHLYFFYKYHSSSHLFLTNNPLCSALTYPPLEMASSIDSHSILANSGDSHSILYGLIFFLFCGKYTYSYKVWNFCWVIL